MSDNVIVTSGSGTTIAADELVDATLGTVKVQYVKLMDGTLDSSTKAAVGAAGLKVDGSGATQPVSGSLTTVSTVTSLTQMNGAAISMGTGVRGAGVQRVTISTDDVVPASQSGTWTVQPGNTANTTPWLAKLSDGTNAVAVKASSTAPTATDPSLVVSISPNSVNANGQAVSANSAPVVLSSGQTFSGQNQTAPTNQIAVGGQFNTTPTTITSGNVSPLQMDNAGNLLVNIKAGASSGAVSQGSTTSGQTGGLIQAAVTTSAPSYTTAQTSPLSLDTSGLLRVNNSGVTQPCAGEVAAGSSDSGNPQKIGGVGHTANPSAVTDGQRVNAIFDKLGKQVVVGSVRDLKINQFTTITSSTAETTVLTAVASTFLDVYGCIIENTSASSCKVTFKDSTAGTTQFELTVPAGDTRGFMLPESGAFKQTTVNTNWTATCGTSLASIVITMLAVKNI